MKVNEVPNGMRVNVTSNITNCNTGELISGFNFWATATAEYTFDDMGIPRRLFINCEPLVFGVSEIWLSWKNFDKKSEQSLVIEKELESTDV